MNDVLEHLHNPIVRKNLETVGKIRHTARRFLEVRGFQEFDTPVLLPKTGEPYNPTFDIAVDGRMASLADSPQIFKMMLMLAGYEKYYQFAHCFRPIKAEGEKHTRLCEFTQMDIEMQASSLNVLTDFAEKLIVQLCADIGMPPGISHMDGIDCRNTYGSDMKPDLRAQADEISIVFIEHLPLTNGERTKNNGLIPCHHIFALPSGGISGIMEDDLVNTVTESFDIVVNGIEVGGGDLRIMDRALQQKMMELFCVEKERYTKYFDMLEQYTGGQSGGFAIGLERFEMALSGCENIRQTVCFPDFYKRSGC